MELLRGHVYRVSLEPVIGHEQHGEARPVVVLSKECVQPPSGHGDCGATGNQCTSLPPAIISVPSVGVKSVALCEHIRSLDRRRLQREIGALSAEDSAAVEEGVAALMGLTA